MLNTVKTSYASGLMGRLYTYGYGHSVWEVTGLHLSCGTIVGVFHSARQLARFTPPNMPSILNLVKISLRGEAINYRLYASPSFEVASHVNKLPFRPLLLLSQNLLIRTLFI